MSTQRLNAIDPETAQGKTKELLDGIQKKFGMAPNILRTMANSPAVLGGIWGLIGSLEQGVLPAKLREQIALVVAQTNGCHYCLSAHTAIGKSVGLSEEELMDSRRGRSSQSRIEKALRFSRQVAENRGHVTESDLAGLRGAGYSDEEIVEIFANTLLHIFNNYFNAVAKTAVDFPLAPDLP